MAVLGPGNYVRVWFDGLSDKAALYTMRNVTTNDTCDLFNDFAVVKQAVALGTTVSGTSACVVTGTVVTMPVGLNHDAAYLLAWGCSS